MELTGHADIHAVLELAGVSWPREVGRYHRLALRHGERLSEFSGDPAGHTHGPTEHRR